MQYLCFFSLELSIQKLSTWSSSDVMAVQRAIMLADAWPELCENVKSSKLDNSGMLRSLHLTAW